MIERRRPSPNKPQRRQRKLKPGYAAINRNLANYPLARDVRVAAHWRKSNKTGRWLCDLPGDQRIQFRLPSDYKPRRCPTGFDVNVLFVLLREARLRKTGKIEFPSLASILKDLGVRIDDYNRQRLRDSLQLWSHLSLRHIHWYDAIRSIQYSPCVTREELMARVRREKHVRKLLPPPIRRIETDCRRVRIVVAKPWRALASRYYAQVPLPLPLNAAAQNLVLCLATSRRYRDSEPGCEMKWERPIRKLCWKLGLNHATRGRALEHAIKIAEVWFAERGIKLNEVRREGQIIFYLTALEAKVERQHLRKPTTALPEPEIDDEETEGNVYDDDGNRVA
jgi:hypothetical protein